VGGWVGGRAGSRWVGGWASAVGQPEGAGPAKSMGLLSDSGPLAVVVDCGKTD
jgi:hypothetical protein